MSLDRFAYAVIDRVGAHQIDDARPFELISDGVAQLGKDDGDAVVLGLGYELA